MFVTFLVFFKKNSADIKIYQHAELLLNLNGLIGHLRPCCAIILKTVCRNTIKQLRYWSQDTFEISMHGNCSKISNPVYSFVTGHTGLN